jgi:hypothetical protein
MRGRLFSYLVVFFLLGLGGAIPTILSPTPCWGSESGEGPVVFSLDVKDEPLGEVLKKISKATGYEITIATEYTKIPITARLQGVGVEKGLNRVLKDFNHALVVIDAEKKISVKVYGFFSGPRPFKALPMEGKNNQLVQQQEIDQRDLEVIPPEHPGEKGVTQAEIDAERALQGEAVLDLEVIPPDRPGERGLTRREIEAARRSYKEESSP